MLHALTYSVITHLKATVPALKDVVWMYDGITLTGRTKPYVTVEQMQENMDVLAKERAYYEVIYRFQIGLRTNSISERSRLTEAVRMALMQPNIQLLNTNGPAPVSAGYFYCDITAVVPMPVDEMANETDKHRVYFDVEIITQYRNGSDKFEQ
ncbi:hypothetical protein GJU41_12020 [Bacillus idriensis]|uniref:Uncharacterized protein n=1 Tax=Metabacillus idriensis TaxID=324768 RepID=A0A6I2M942_9BACI|nr:hypothetical protein [Metabacillus idriensis]MRX54700.1 hypothetical protein [Metabacillus idriensis]